MNGFGDANVVVCRPALEKDTEEVLELASHIWDGGDYLPLVWQGWLKEAEGMLGVAELAGRVVGTFKLTRFETDEWYLEGLRVHPDFQGRSIAAHIHDYVVETWREMGMGVLRLTTGSYNVKVHRMCERTGFKRVAEFIPYRAPSLPGVTGNFTHLKLDEAERALEFVTSSPLHALSSGLINLGWVYANPRLKHIYEAIRDQHAWWWKGGLGFLSIWEDEESEEREPGIELVACEVGNLEAMLSDYRHLVGEIGYHSAGWVAPNQSEVLSCLEKAGFQRSWDVSLYIYELRLPDR